MVWKQSLISHSFFLNCYWIIANMVIFCQNQGNEASLPMEMCSNCELISFFVKYYLKSGFNPLTITLTIDLLSDNWMKCISVDADEIKRLGKRFRKLDLDNSGSLSVDEFMSLPELQQNPLVQRVIDIFDTDRNGEVDFKGNKYTQMRHCLRLLLLRVHSRSFSV